ncbi:MAG: VWA domain-containing protein [Candidatus Poribacteria bacterium]|nr:VWA domain-containing protein [Candidatus Poribacteria bacterium]
MKSKVSKSLSNALILSIGIHVVLVFFVIGLHQSEPRSITDITYLEISEVRSQRALRPLKRNKYIPPKITPITHKQIEVNVNHPVESVPTPQPIAHRNPVTPVNGLSLPDSDTLGVGNSLIDSTTPSVNEGIDNQTRIGNIKPPGVFRNKIQQSVKPTIDDTLPQVSDLPLPHVILERIGQHIVSNRTTDSVDIVFVIDASGSMQDNINAVRIHLNRMTELFDEANIDFTLGIVVFRDKIFGVDFEVFPQTRSVPQTKRLLAQVKCQGGEKALDALIRAADEVDFRQNADVHFILITDEYVSGNYSAKDVLNKISRAKIKVDVIGRDEKFQKFIAQSTGGLWLPISSLGTH